jgi:hypothetical protein
MHKSVKRLKKFKADKKIRNSNAKRRWEEKLKFDFFA